MMIALYFYKEESPDTPIASLWSMVAGNSRHTVM